ncbi:MAG: hypothetical protein IKI95_05895 [Clostridia bacterium]|nr:hypothetical protein [Clostridia bacterium]
MEFDLEKITTSIQEKLGKETSAMITDDLANIITIKSNYDKEIEDNKKQISKLKKDKDVLIEANGNLLQKVKMGAEPKKEEKEEKKTDAKNFDFSAMFDEKGNFKKVL